MRGIEKLLILIVICSLFPSCSGKNAKLGDLKQHEYALETPSSEFEKAIIRKSKICDIGANLSKELIELQMANFELKKKVNINAVLYDKLLKNNTKEIENLVREFIKRENSIIRKEKYSLDIGYSFSTINHNIKRDHWFVDMSDYLNLFHCSYFGVEVFGGVEWNLSYSPSNYCDPFDRHESLSSRLSYYYTLPYSFEKNYRWEDFYRGTREYNKSKWTLYDESSTAQAPPEREPNKSSDKKLQKIDKYLDPKPQKIERIVPPKDSEQTKTNKDRT